MGRTAYEAIAASMTTTSTDHPFADILNAGARSSLRTLKTADWANTIIAAGDGEKIDKLRLGGDGHIVVWGGVSLWVADALDLIDELSSACSPTLRARAPGCSTASPSPTASTWSPVPPPATGSELQYRRHRYEDIPEHWPTRRSRYSGSRTFTRDLNQVAKIADREPDLRPRPHDRDFRQLS